MSIALTVVKLDIVEKIVRNLRTQTANPKQGNLGHNLTIHTTYSTNANIPIGIGQ